MRAKFTVEEDQKQDLQQAGESMGQESREVWFHVFCKKFNEHSMILDNKTKADKIGTNSPQMGTDATDQTRIINTSRVRADPW
jgi:hypothetical protein